MRPGSRVFFERSMTVASRGMETLDPTALTLEPSTRMIWFARTEPLFGSINLPALMTVICDRLDEARMSERVAISEIIRCMDRPPEIGVKGRSS
jgi:hypothetical protein